jgi:hypothetical protein
MDDGERGVPDRRVLHRLADHIVDVAIGDRANGVELLGDRVFTLHE